MSDPVRVGVVGAGAIAQVAHLVALSKRKDADLVAICDIDGGKAQALASRFQIPDVYDDIEAMLEYAKPDVVVICTPNHLHEVHTVTALSAGAHVLCERPLAVSLDGVERVVEALRHTDRLVMVGMNHRFRNDVRAIRDFVKGNELGTLHGIRAGWYIFRPAGVGASWRERLAESGGGAMFDLGLPLLDVALWTAGQPIVRRCSASFATHESSEVEDSACALVHCDGNLSIYVDVSWRHVGPKEKVWFEVMGEEGSARIGRFGVFKEMHGQPVDVTPAPIEPGDAFTDSYRSEWDAFLRMVRGEDPPVSLDDQVLLHRLMQAIRESAEEAREVSL